MAAQDSMCDAKIIYEWFWVLPKWILIDGRLLSKATGIRRRNPIWYHNTKLCNWGLQKDERYLWEYNRPCSVQHWFFSPRFHQEIQIEFGLCKEVAVNAVICITTLKKWKAIFSFEGNFIISPLLQTKFPLIYKTFNTGHPFSAAFDYKEFIWYREVKSSDKTLVMNMSLYTPNINLKKHVKHPSIFTVQEWLLRPSNGINLDISHKLVHFRRANYTTESHGSIFVI